MAARQPDALVLGQGNTVRLGEQSVTLNPRSGPMHRFAPGNKHGGARRLTADEKAAQVMARNAASRVVSCLLELLSHNSYHARIKAAALLLPLTGVSRDDPDEKPSSLEGLPPAKQAAALREYAALAMAAARQLESDPGVDGAPRASVSDALRPRASSEPGPTVCDTETEAGATTDDTPIGGEDE